MNQGLQFVFEIILHSEWGQIHEAFAKMREGGLMMQKVN